MNRRKFLRGITVTAGASAGLDLAAPASHSEPIQHAHENRFVNWRVMGFYCVTCAVGLEVMLRGMKGVTRAAAVWPSGHVTVGFDDRLISEKALREFIAECGFSIAVQPV
jgi:hypothetical protein